MRAQVPPRLRRVHRAFSSNGGSDAGFGLIEVLVSLMVIVVVSIPVTRLVLETSSTSNQIRLRVEATDLATKALETDEFELENGTSVPIGAGTTSQIAGNTTFFVTSDLEYVSGSGSNTSICTSGANSATSKIEEVTATVAWGGPVNSLDVANHRDVAERTLIAPAVENYNAVSRGEIAVPVYLGTNQTSLDTSTPVNITLTASCPGGGCGTLPSPVTVNTGQTGCALFTDLATGFTYTPTALNDAGIVQQTSQDSDSPSAASGPPTVAGVVPAANTVSPASAFYLGLGETVNIGFQLGGTGSTSASCTPTTTTLTPAPPTDLQVTVYQDGGSVQLGGSTYFSSAGGQSALIYPSASGATLWAGDDTNGSTYGGQVSVPTTASGCETVILPLKALNLTKATIPSGLEITDAASSIVLNAAVTMGATQESSTSVPTGFYQLSAGATPVNPPYLLVKSAGIYECTGSTVGTCSATAAPNPIPLS